MTMRSVAIRSVSLVDLKKAVPFVRQMTIEEILDRNTDSVLQPFLHEMGMNINREIEWQACKHRTFDGEAVLDFRVVGYERTDPAWLCSKYSTMEALIFSQKDDELRSDLIRASSEGVGEKDIQNYVMNTYSLKNVQRSSKKEMIEEDFEQMSVIIEAMRSKIEEVRGFVEE